MIMTYKYETWIKHLVELRLATEGIDLEEETRAWDELKVVYAKAKVFDEIKKLRNSYYTYSKRDSGELIALLDAKPFGREVSHIINKKEYMEEKQVEGIDMLERKAKAFDEIVEVFKDYPSKTDSDVMDFIQAKLDDMEDK